MFGYNLRGSEQQRRLFIQFQNDFVYTANDVFFIVRNAKS
jgi:hypothetical protein